jgi:hypothetical protein
MNDRISSQFGLYGNTNRPPTYRDKPAETPVPDAFIAGPPTDELLKIQDFGAAERWDIVNTNPIPEARPSLLGLRGFILERRLSHEQKLVEKQAEKVDVIRGIATAVRQGKSYMHETNPTRPSSIPDRIAAWRIESIEYSRRARQSRANHLVNTVIDTKGPKPTNRLGEYIDSDSPGERTPGKRTLGDRWSIQKNRALKTAIDARNNEADRQVEDIVSRPVTKLERAVRKREELVVKAEAVRLAKARKARMKAARRSTR